MQSQKVKIFREDGEAFQRWGDLDEAERCYIKALNCEGGNGDHQTFYRMAELFLEKRDPHMALDYHILAIQADKDNLLYKQRFLDIAGAMLFEGYNADVEDILLQCLNTPGLDFSNAGSLWSTILRNTPEFAALYQDRQLFEKKFDPAPLLKPYFLHGLKEVSVYEPAFEDFIRRLRQWLLMGLSSRRILSQADYLRLADAVAAYCFYGGFIIRTTAAEQAKLREISRHQPADPLSVAIRTCYGRHGVCDVFAPDSAHQQIKAENVSAALSENAEGPLPCPRWRAVPAQTLEAKLFFPPRKERLERTFAGTRPELLIVGCGAGREAIITALYYPKGKITAIDSCGENIDYASLKSREYNIDNIVFRQDAITNLAKIPKPYDIIYTDILHYQPEPRKAWQVLWDNLRPAGIMKINLPSGTALQPVFAAQGIIQKFNIGSNRESIMDFRARSPELLPRETLENLSSRPEYYNFPLYRDLLFRPDKHCFSLPEIEKMLAELHLLFEGFDLPAATLQRYAERFPDDPDMISLNNWHIFEQEAPETFVGMYRFWCRKC